MYRRPNKGSTRNDQSSEVTLKDWWRIASRELPAGLVLGALLGVIGIIRIVLWQKLGIYDYGAQWPPDSTDCGARFDRDRHVRINDGLDVAVYSEAVQIRSGGGIGAVRGDAGRCDWADHILQRRIYRTARHIAVMPNRAPVSSRDAERRFSSRRP